MLPHPAKTALKFVLLSDLPSVYTFSSFLWLLSGQNRVTHLARHSPSLSFQRPCTRIVCLSAHRTRWGSHPQAVDLLGPSECLRSLVCKCYRRPHKSLRD